MGHFNSIFHLLFRLYLSSSSLGVVQLRHLQLRELLWLQLHHIHILHRGWGLSCLIIVAGVPSSSAILVATSSPSSSSSWRWRCWPCTVGGTPFSIGSQCAFLAEDGCSFDTILGVTVQNYKTHWRRGRIVSLLSWEFWFVKFVSTSSSSSLFLSWGLPVAMCTSMREVLAEPKMGL